jgi:hypothetical protein
MKTKYGSTRLCNGYHRIYTRNEGNEGKMLHRLIWEEVNGFIPDGYHIHHKDGNKLNNELSNLQCIEKCKHIQYHNYIRDKPNDETRLKMSKAQIGNKNHKYIDLEWMKEWILKMNKIGISPTDIGSHLDVSRQTIERRIKQWR